VKKNTEVENQKAKKTMQTLKKESQTTDSLWQSHCTESATQGTSVVINATKTMKPLLQLKCHTNIPVT